MKSIKYSTTFIHLHFKKKRVKYIIVSYVKKTYKKKKLPSIGI